MLHTRLWVGTLLALAAGGVLVADAAFAPHFPCLFLCVLTAGALATRELIALLPADTRPRRGASTTGVLLILAANWWYVIDPGPGSRWEPVLFTVLVVTLAAFLLEMATYRGNGGCTGRVANTVFVTAYLGLLASCFVRTRFDISESGLALAAAIFVPKCGDIGAYVVGRLVGRNKFSPLLSPKKTWEGFAGGMAVAVATAVGFWYLGGRELFRHGMVHAVAFGLLVGLAGVTGDLAESMVKRDAQSKDASNSIPGFGGLLDVIDSVLFAAPVAYLVLRL